MGSPCFHSGALRIFPAARELWRDGRRVAVPPKSFECIAYLLVNRDRAIGRDELISAVWGRVDVSDAVVAQTLWRARRAIGDTGNQQTAIRTVSRFGYRWVAEVERECAGSDDTPVSAPLAQADCPSSAADERDAAVGAAAARPPASGKAPALQTAGPLRGRRFAWAILAIAVAFLAVGTVLALQQRRPPTASASGNGVLVLPVGVADADQHDAWIRLGAMDFLNARLREQGGLPVIPGERMLAALRPYTGGPRLDPTQVQRLRELTGARRILAPQARHGAKGWEFSIDSYEGDSQRRVQAEAAEPLTAAIRAADRFLASIGRPLPIGASDDASEWLARMQAAVLSADLTEAHRLVDAAAPGLRGDPRFQVIAAQVAFRSGDFDAAERQFQALTKPGTGTGFSAIRAKAMVGLAEIATRRLHYDVSEKLYSQVISACEAGCDPELRGRAFRERGVVRGLRDEFDPAMSDFARARAELARGNDRLGIATLDGNIAIVESHRGHFSAAIAAGDRAIATFGAFGVEDALAIALGNQSNAQRLVLDLRGADASSARAWNAAARLENPLIVQFLAIQRIATLIAVGRLDDAQALLDRFRAGKPAADIDPLLTIMRADILLQQGHPAAALRLADAVPDPGRHRGEDAFVSTAARVFVDAALRTERMATAERFARALQAGDGRGDPQHAFVLELVQAEVLGARRDPAAKGHFDKAIAMADGNGRAADVVAAGLAYARYLVQGDDRDAASALVGRLAPWVDRAYPAARACAALYRMLGEPGLARANSDRAARLAAQRDPNLPL
jgi:DNA-binding winged helix-turn-helix (wHTH) protein/tetratricopeptide (TPR) repeat protein